MRVEIYLDAISNYSFLALAFLARYQHIWNIDIHVHTVSLPFVIKKAGNTPPGFVASKATLYDADFTRNAKLFDLPITGMPTNHPGMPQPKGTVLIQTKRFNHLVAAVSEEFGTNSQQTLKTQLAVYDTMYIEYGKKNLIPTDSVLVSTLAKAGITGDLAQKLLILSKELKIAETVMQNSDRALALKMFGAPFMVVSTTDRPRPEIFFGSDRFEQMAFLYGLPYYGIVPQRIQSKL